MAKAEGADRSRHRMSEAQTGRTSQRRRQRRRRLRRQVEPHSCITTRIHEAPQAHLPHPVPVLQAPQEHLLPARRAGRECA